MTGAASAAEITRERIARARESIGDVARRTPVVPSATLSALASVPVWLKAENLQRVGSFKVRGGLAKLAAIGDECRQGVVCGSAGNHAQAVALAARERGVRCEVVMPEGAPVAKVEAAQALGAEVTLAGESVIEAVAVARERADRSAMTFVHPFDDPDVICGQGTLGLELLEQVPEAATVLVPVGGGGLLGGVAVAVKASRPDVRVIGVESSVVPSMSASLRHGSPQTVPAGSTIADGIAVKAPSDLTLELARTWADGCVTVEDDEIADAMVLLLEKAKLVVEPAGAVAVAALMNGKAGSVQDGPVCVVLSGGNVDPGLLAAIARRGESLAGRRHVLFTRVSDRPGGLARLLGLVASAGANLVDLTHIREGIGLHVGETGVQLVVETRSREHAAELAVALRAAGYEVDAGVSSESTS